MYSVSSCILPGRAVVAASQSAAVTWHSLDYHQSSYYSAPSLSLSVSAAVSLPSTSQPDARIATVCKLYVQFSGLVLTRDRSGLSNWACFVQNALMLSHHTWIYTRSVWCRSWSCERSFLSDSVLCLMQVHALPQTQYERRAVGQPICSRTVLSSGHSATLVYSTQVPVLWLLCTKQWRFWGLHLWGEGGGQWGGHNCSWGARTYIATVNHP